MKKLCLYKVCLRFVGLMSISSLPLIASVQLNSDPNKRITVQISSDSMNRIAFANDRISQVFGDEEAYTLQTDETRGQIFLKPSEANAEKPISITLTTEHNVVQDLELIPQKIATRTIILKNDVKGEVHATQGKAHAHGPIAPSGYLGVQNFNPHSSHGYSAFDHNRVETNDHVSRLVRVLKYVGSQDVLSTIKGGETPTELAVTSLKSEGVGVMIYQGFHISIYTLSNTAEQSYEVVENTFKGRDVLAVAIEKKQLAPGESTRLFVVRNV